MPKHHVIISGTGRTGTTFLVQLLTELGLDTGFASSQSDIQAHCNAGMEKDLRAPDAPYVVKSPWICEYLDDVMRTGRVVIDHAIVPMRDLYAAAESRRDVVNRAGATGAPNQVSGGLWLTQNSAHQETVLAGELYKLMLALAHHEIPLTLLAFPRLVKEPDYLYRALRPVLLQGIEDERFLGAFQRVARPELIHDFKPRRV